MATPDLPRTVRLKAWMAEHNITFRDVAEQLSISTNSAHKFLNQDTIPVKHHTVLVSLGFPVELLPVAFDKRPGRPVAKPNFPGLAMSAEGARA